MQGWADKAAGTLPGRYHMGCAAWAEFCPYKLRTGRSCPCGHTVLECDRLPRGAGTVHHSPFAVQSNPGPVVPNDSPNVPTSRRLERVPTSQRTAVLSESRHPNVPPS
eukprot:362360-Chlamydomonas_euryale.AAC.12